MVPGCRSRQSLVYLQARSFAGGLVCVFVGIFGSRACLVHAEYAAGGLWILIWCEYAQAYSTDSCSLTHQVNSGENTMARGAEQSDAQLVKRVQKGDRQAFDFLVLKHQYKVQAVISRFIRDQAEVQDIAQEAFIKAYRAVHNFRGESQFYTWLYRIAVNTAKNHLVTRNRRPPSDDIDINEAESYGGSEYLKDNDTPEGEMYRGELEQAVFHAIAELPEDLRTAVTLREMEGMSYEEIAEVMECPVGTVRSRIFRAREAITDKIRPLME